MRGTLANIVEQVSKSPLERTATILVGPVLGDGVLAEEEFRESALYSSDYQRRFRGRGA